MSAANQATSVAWEFHARTKYVPGTETGPDSDILMGDRADNYSAIGEQDLAIEPLVYKMYTTLPPLPLPRPGSSLPVPALAALAGSGDAPAGEAVPTLEDLARICLRTNGLLKTWRNSRGRLWEFRAAGCTGARYHVELYLVTGDIPGLAAGVYHYAAHDHSLRQLRRGDFRGVLLSATASEPGVAAAPAIVVTTSTFWRNAWRYQERAYRHVFWDTGTQLANLLAVSAAAKLPARPVLGFVDADVNALLGVDGEREAAITLVPVGRTGRQAPNSPPVRPISHPTEPISTREIAFPAIQMMHSASGLRSEAEVERWRTAPGATAPAVTAGERIALAPLSSNAAPRVTIEDVIAGRRSYRKYDLESALSFTDFSTVLGASHPRPELDCLRADPRPPTERTVLVNRVEGLAPGIYRVLDQGRSLVQIASRDITPLAYELACYQEYAGEAHVNVYETAALRPVLERFGNRGYWVAQLTGAIAGARMQLAAHALGLGAVGSTSFDDLVTEAVSGDGDPQSFMFVAVFGERRPRPAVEQA